MTNPIEYHRPESLEEALALLCRPSPVTRPLAGGTGLAPGAERPAAVVDLAALPLSGITRRDARWRIGATTTLEALAAASDLPEGVRQAAARHAPRNIRQRATVGGVVAARSSGPLTAALLALDARVTIEPGGLSVPLEVYLNGEIQGRLIVAVDVPDSRLCALSEISKTPADAPVMVVAVGAERVSGGLRRFIAAAAGSGQPAFILPGAAQLLEGAPRADLLALAAVTPDLPWRSDARGSAEYRGAMTPVLLRRAAAQLLAEVNHAS